MAKIDNDDNQDFRSDIQNSIHPEYTANRKMSENASRLKEKEENAGSNLSKDNSNNEIAEKEETAGAVQDSGWKTNVSSQSKGTGRKLGKFKFSSLKKFLPLAVVVSALSAIGIILYMIFGGLFGSIDFVATVVDDLSYQVASQKVRRLMMQKNTLAKAGAKEFLNGCGKLSIRCRFKSMTAKEIGDFDKAGIKVNYGTVEIVETKTTKFDDGSVKTEETRSSRKSNGLDFGKLEDIKSNGKVETKITRKFIPDNEAKIGKRFGIDSIEVGDQLYTADNLVDGYMENMDFRIKKVIAEKLKTKSFRDSAFVKGILERFRVSTKPAGLKGKSSEDKVSNAMIKENLNSLDDIVFIDDGNGNYKIKGGSEGQIYNERQKLKLEKSLAKTKIKMSPLGKTALQAMKALSIIGYVDAGCSLIQMIGFASIAAKTNNASQLMDFSMPILSYIGKVKTNDITDVEASEVIEWFSRVDTRKKLYDTVNDKEYDNPNYNESINDSELYMMSKTGEVPKVSTNMMYYSLGMSSNRLKLASGAGYVLNKMLNAGTNDLTCRIVQNWIVRGAGLLGTVVAAFFSEGAELAWNAAQAAGIIAGFMTIGYMINSFLEQDLITGDMAERPNEVATINWTALSIIQAENAKVRGMFPGNIPQISAYNELQNQSKLDDIAAESQNTKPWDMRNPYSFIGVMANIVSRYIKPNTNISSSISGVKSMIYSSIASAFTPQKLLAKNFDPKRYEMCNDIQYIDTDIATDVQCNLSYVMPAEDLALDTDEVAKYMEENKYVAENTETGLPVVDGEEYTPPNTGVEQESFEKSTLEWIEGKATDFGKSYLRQFYDKRNKFYSNPYAVYLDYCVYRTLPYGYTYEDGGEFGDVSEEWATGEKCRDTNDKMMSNFRAYTMDVSLISTLDQ